MKNILFQEAAAQHGVIAAYQSWWLYGRTDSH